LSASNLASRTVDEEKTWIISSLGRLLDRHGPRQAPTNAKFGRRPDSDSPIWVRAGSIIAPVSPTWRTSPTSRRLSQIAAVLGEHRALEFTDLPDLPYCSVVLVKLADPGRDPRGAPDLMPIWTIVDSTPEGRSTGW
jgi:hypothetical protein